MTLLSATEDFATRSLSAVPGVLAKLRYVAAMRRENGHYEHWGMERIYGTQTVRQVLESTHRELVLQVLRMPLSELLNDALECAQRAEVSPIEYVAQLKAEADALVPEDIGGGSVRHFSTVLKAISGLTRSCMDANRLVS